MSLYFVDMSLFEYVKWPILCKIYVLYWGWHLVIVNLPISPFLPPPFPLFSFSSLWYISQNVILQTLASSRTSRLCQARKIKCLRDTALESSQAAPFHNAGSSSNLSVWIPIALFPPFSNQWSLGESVSNQSCLKESVVFWNFREGRGLILLVRG